jgi:Mg-chelatase subunit ChlD
MRNLKLPAQGMTNIPAGVEKSLGIIKSQEMSHINSKSKEPRTHHILILLSDGHHNTGQPPEKVFPNFTSILPEDTKLSTIVVGFSQQSSTSMGMLLKKSTRPSPSKPMLCKQFTLLRAKQL